MSWFQSHGFPHLNRLLPAVALRLVQRSAESLAKHQALPSTSPEVIITIYQDQIHSTHRAWCVSAPALIVYEACDAWLIIGNARGTKVLQSPSKLPHFGNPSFLLLPKLLYFRSTSSPRTATRPTITRRDTSRLTLPVCSGSVK